MISLAPVAALALALCMTAPAAVAQARSPAGRPSAAAQPPDRGPDTGLSAELFYQLLLGELSARSDDPGLGFSLVLDAARKTDDPQLYRRAVDIALQARAGESALQAARAWKQARPDSREANRFTLQILLALNRTAETLAPLKAELAMAPPAERESVLASVPRLYARASDKKQAAQVVEQALAEALVQPESRSDAWTVVGRMRLAAGDRASALAAAQSAHAANPASEAAALLALELIEPRTPQAEAMVRRYLAGDAPLPELRMAYARVLLDAQRLADAQEQLQRVTTEKPELAEAWLVHGLLQVQDNRLAAGEASLLRYLDLIEKRRDAADRSRGRSQAFLALSQIAEKRGDLTRAAAWLDRIENARDLVSAQARRASILAQQGKLEEGRKLLQALPERNPEDARMKLMAEVQLLRDNKAYPQARQLLEQASAKNPDDAELLYDWALIAEKQGDHLEAERLLRRVIERKPDFHHAYNALGYSMAERNVRLPEAKRLIQKALDMAPGDPFITDSLAWVEYRMGNSAEALRLLEQAYRQRPDAEIAAHFGEVLWSTGQRQRARDIWKEGLLLDRENATLVETLRRFQVAP
ncbi:tetratricopeptide repeat protein [Ramlibacter sp. AN1015]|uniref:tetratricopeptide repeat protein n=1 Tax=Ramlibacter sp. AN1015 TaxID=3133428 RepID=UPI0030C36E2B